MKKKLNAKKKTAKASPAAKKGINDLTVVYKKPAEVLSRTMLDDTISIVHINNLKSYFKLDAWAAEVWSLIDGKSSLQKIALKIQKASKLEQHLVEKEANKLVKQLVKNNLLIQVN